MTDDEIQALIVCPKTIIRAEPSNGYSSCNLNWKKKLQLGAGNKPHHRKFSVFIRQNEKFTENFSIGLQYKAGDKDLGEINLIRYNGPHGVEGVDRSGDKHYSSPHIHRITAAWLQREITQPREQTITELYSTFDEALWEFAKYCNIANWQVYFPVQFELLPN